MPVHYRFLLSALGMALAVAASVAVAVTALDHVDEAAAARKQVRLTIKGADDLLSGLKDAETGERGFVVTGDERFLVHYVAVKGQLRGQLEQLRQRSVEPAALAHLDALVPLVDAKMVELATVIALRRAGDSQVAAAALISGRGKKVMDAIRQEVAEFSRLQDALAEQTEAEFQETLRRMFLVLAVASAMAVLLAAAFLWLSYRHSQQKVRNLLAAHTQQLLEEQKRISLRLEQAVTTWQASEEKLAVTLNCIGDGVMAADAQGRVTLLNPRAEMLTGWLQTEALGRSIEEVFHILDEETRVREPDPVAAALRTGQLQRLAARTVLLRRDGSECAIADSCAPIRDPRGQLSGAVLVFRDVTDQRRLELALSQNNLELAAAKSMAEKANVAKSEFLSNMSHEIRTPMNAILGMAYLALRTDLTQHQRDYLDKIQASARHLLGIINDILDFSRIEAAQLTVERTEFELEKVLANVANLIGEKAGAKGLELVFAIDKLVPARLIGDPLRLGQVLVNFCNNAVKFTEQGEIDVLIGLEREDDQGLLLRCAVRDTGLGLSKEQMGRLFQRFSQADASTTREFGGTGLGLAICKRLAELMGGEVGVHSEQGQGSTFWFTARLQRGTGQARGWGLAQDLQGKRILVVDDNDNARQVLSELLQSLCLQVDQAASGQLALAAVEQADRDSKPYAIVCLDWLMPELDGIATAQQLGKLVLKEPPHLLMVTAHGREQVYTDARAIGIEDVLVKPVSASQLYECVVRVLGGDSVDSAARPAESPGHFEQLAGLRGARVLLVEDNLLNQEVAAELLRTAGFAVVVADDGQVALNRLAEGLYDLVLMDMEMPVMDGLTAVGIIRRDHRLDLMPIVAMTANAQASDRARCLEAGMNDHLAKPIEPELLWQTLLKWIPPRLARTGLQASATGPAADGARPSAAAGEPAPPQDPQQLASIQGRLLAQLQAGDPDAVATWELNNGAFRAAYPQQFRKINQAIRSYDFDAALAALAARPAVPAPSPISALSPISAAAPVAAP